MPSHSPFPNCIPHTALTGKLMVVPTGTLFSPVLSCPTSKDTRAEIACHFCGFRGLSHISIGQCSPSITAAISSHHLQSDEGRTDTAISLFPSCPQHHDYIPAFLPLTFSFVSLLSGAHAVSSLFACTYKNDCYKDNLNYS